MTSNCNEVSPWGRQSPVSQQAKKIISHNSGGVFMFPCALNVRYNLTDNSVYCWWLEKKHNENIYNKETYRSLSVVLVTSFLVKLIFVLVQPNLSDSQVVLAWVGTADKVVHCTMSEDMANVRARQNFNRPTTHPNLHNTP